MDTSWAPAASESAASKIDECIDLRLGSVSEPLLFGHCIHAVMVVGEGEAGLAAQWGRGRPLEAKVRQDALGDLFIEDHADDSHRALAIGANGQVQQVRPSEEFGPGNPPVALGMVGSTVIELVTHPPAAALKHTG